MVFDMGVLDYFVRFFLLRKDMNWLTMGVAFLDYYWHKKKRRTGLTLGETRFLFFAFGLIWIWV